MTEHIHPIIDDISNLLAKHRCVPFLGAGCSAAHLGIDWDAIRDKMCKKLSFSAIDHLDVASKFISRFGRELFCDFLRDYLIINEFNEDFGNTHLAILSLNIGVIYTTNQDNILEKCYEKYGRHLNVVSDLTEIASMIPIFPVLYKFHGDLSKPETIVFAKEDYDKRMSLSEFPLDIRLKSDTLAKSFLFIGYSFRDLNIMRLFNNLNRLFGAHLPKSYLIQFSPNKDFERTIYDDYGIIAVDCRQVFPEAKTDSEAFEMFMLELSRNVLSKKSLSEITTSFRPPYPSLIPVATKHDVFNVQNIVKEKPLNEAIGIFCATFDSFIIPDKYENQVAEIFIHLCKGSNGENDCAGLNSALFNLMLSKPQIIFECISAYFAAINTITSKDRASDIIWRPSGKYWDNRLNIFAVARAIEMLREWGHDIKEGLFGFIQMIQHDFLSEEEIPDEAKPYIKQQFEFAYQRGKTRDDNPLKYIPKKPHKSVFKIKTYQDISKSMIDKIPKRFKIPYNE